MMTPYYIGFFFILFGFALMGSKNKSNKGKETWESKHNIVIKKWWYILSFVAGILFTLVSYLS